MTEQALSPMAGIIIFAVSAVIILLFIFNSLSGFQGSFESTICKFNAWMRASTIGNPVIQSLMGAGSFMTGGFGGMTSSLTIPLICNEAPDLPPQDEPYTLEQVVHKVSEESVNCWDQFGLGKWDPLFMSSQGQSFTCFQQLLTIKCDCNSITSLWKEGDGSFDLIEAQYGADKDNSGKIDNNECYFNSDVLLEYLDDHRYSYSGLEMTYADILPKAAPKIGLDLGGLITCDNTEREYFIGLYYVDSFASATSFASVSLICKSLTAGDLQADSLYLCIYEQGGLT